MEKFWNPLVPLVLALYGHPDSGGLWEQHLNTQLGSVGWRQVLPEMWQSVFYHDDLKLLLVIYVDDFKLAGPTENLKKGWETISSKVDIGSPEPYDRYFGCLHREALDTQLPKSAHPFAHVFEKTPASACQHRTNDYWHHDPESKTWTRVHLQPRKKLYEPVKEGDAFVQAIQGPRHAFFDTPVCVTALNADGHVMPQEQCDALRYQADHDLRPNCFWTGCTIFEYGEPNDACTLYALASKMRPGPHRDKRDAKNAAKKKRFKEMDDCVEQGQCMTKKVNIVQYDMADFLASCVDAYCELAHVKPEQLGKATTPFCENGIARPTASDEEPPGKLKGIASKVLMKILFAARI